MCVCVHRQICDLREPPGQLGSWSHRPEQWDIRHAWTEQSTGQDGQAAWGHLWICDLLVLFTVRVKELTSVPLCCRPMEASEVYHLWKLGGWRIWPDWLCRIHRGNWQLIHKVRQFNKSLISKLPVPLLDWIPYLFHTVFPQYPSPGTNITLILSFLQQYFTKLSERTVAYINVDIAVFGKKCCLLWRTWQSILTLIEWANEIILVGGGGLGVG